MKKLVLGTLTMFAAAIACTSGGGRSGGGSGGSDGNSGGSGGSRTGGSRAGGAGGARSGGSTGSGGSASGGSASGGSASGGSAAGGSSTMGGMNMGGMNMGGMNMGGMNMGGAQHVAGPVWDFETDLQGWDNGVAHLNAAQCVHNRLAPVGPEVSTEQHMTGTKSLKFTFNAATAKTMYETVSCVGDVDPHNGIALTVGIASDIFQAATRAGAVAGMLPAGTQIRYNVWWPGTMAPGTPMVGFFLPSTGWQQSGPIPTNDQDGWVGASLTLPAALTLPQFGFIEIGIYIGTVPSNFNGSIYVDNIDIVLP